MSLSGADRILFFSYSITKIQIIKDFHQVQFRKQPVEALKSVFSLATYPCKILTSTYILHYYLLKYQTRT